MLCWIVSFEEPFLRGMLASLLGRLLLRCDLLQARVSLLRGRTCLACTSSNDPFRSFLRNALLLGNRRRSCLEPYVLDSLLLSDHFTSPSSSPRPSSSLR